MGISESEINLILIAIASLSLLLLIFLSWRSAQQKSYLTHLSELNLKLERQEALLLERQKQMDEKISRDQQQIIDTIMRDRDRQLKSLAELRVELEKRFADSGSTLSNNVQEFKSQMVEKFETLQRATALSLGDGQQRVSNTVNEFAEKISSSLENYQKQTRDLITDNIRKGISDLRADLDRSLKLQTETVEKSIQGLTESTDNRLKDISGQVEKRLSEGFEKTTKTFNDVLKRLALIDDAQKKITELSSNVVSLQEILNDKRSRGAFGEVQLQSLVSNVMPDSHYKMQYRFSNDKVADCVLELPEPTGKIAIDAKFPLESYKRMMDVSLGESDRKEASRQFSKDIKKHINDIADKYVLPPETSDGAVMFIPAESVFAEIHGHNPELVEFAYQRKVWMVSPTTLMAILTTASAVIKDEQTRQQVHIIKEHLSALGKDFVRFESRMNNLSKHIGQVTKDVEQVHTSARKISSRFSKIERVELGEEEEMAALNLPEPS
ncbi:DNA recombination protein RmuC [Aliikangiella sp. G2MR2-5]|uniref:DNA recombination protein RmuC n=1 Tax=Aliikangiella sp. G2MR2-5 TaxID=2788943 RepID=UPI001FED2F49|nr:DNA recombination protein RmuC [Aliikangiella sp. G2MR2-5]